MVSVQAWYYWTPNDQGKLFWTDHTKKKTRNLNIFMDFYFDLFEKKPNIFHIFSVVGTKFILNSIVYQSLTLIGGFFSSSFSSLMSNSGK